MFQPRVSRRRMLGLVCSFGLVAASGCAASGATDGAQTASVRLLDTPFDADNTRSLLTDFAMRNPNVRVDRQEVPATRFLADLEATLASGSTVDVTFVPAGSLARLADFGLLRDLGQQSGARLLDSVELPWLREQTTLRGVRYGASAWVRLHGFFYNRAYLEKTNQTPPLSFDELHAAGEFIQRRGLGNYAFYWPLKTGPGIFPNDYLADGSSYFDALLAPQFANDRRYAEVLDWRTQAIWKWNLVDPRGLSNEQDNDDSFPHGWATFAWSTYDQLHYWQSSDRFLQSGYLANGLVPSRSTTHVAIGAADLFAIPTTAEQADSAWELLYYLTASDDNRASRLRWTKSGLLFGYSPLVADQSLLNTAAEWADPTVLRDQLGQVASPPAITAPWREEWLSFAKIQSALLVRQSIAPSTFIGRLAQEWVKLQQGWSTHQP